MKRSAFRFVASVLPVLSGLAVVSTAAVARGDMIFGFVPVSSSNTTNTATAGQYTVRVLGPGESFDFGATGSGLRTVGGGQSMFVFQNSAAQQSSITDVYFQDGTLLGISTVFGTAGVAFGYPATPSDLPSGKNLDPDFVTTVGFSADSTPPTMSNGVNTYAEAVGVLINLSPNKSFTDLTLAMTRALADPKSLWWSDSYAVRKQHGLHIPGAPDGLRIGIHVQGFANGGSESFVNGPEKDNLIANPEPSSLVLAALGCLGLTGAVVRSRRSEHKALKVEV